MAKIAIIGTPGAGKTVFLSVLAMRYREAMQGGPWLEYRNGTTQKYVSENWDILSNRQGPDWPAASPVGTFPLLEWTFHTSDDQEHELRVRDPAGHDIIAIYDSAPDILTAEQRQLRGIIDSADIVIFLLNMRPIIDAPNMRTVDEIEIPLKLAMQDVMARGARVAVLLTQHDGYIAFLSAKGKEFHDPSAVLRHWLPQLGGLLTHYPLKIAVFFVAAVAETVAVVDPDGRTYRRPKPGFKSFGLDTIVKYIETELLREKHELKRATKTAEIETLRDEARKACAQRKQRARLRPLTQLAISTLGIVVLLPNFFTAPNESRINIALYLTACALLLFLAGQRTKGSRIKEARIEAGEIARFEDELARMALEANSAPPQHEARRTNPDSDSARGFT